MKNLLGILVFNNLNDNIFIFENDDFKRHIQKLALVQGLTEESVEVSSQDEDIENPIRVNKSHPDVIVQLFSPLITSFHVMGNHFQNSYEVISCEDGTSIVFHEYCGYLLLCIGSGLESYLNRFVQVAAVLIKTIVGPCVSLLKSNKCKRELLQYLLEAWLELSSCEQNFLVEAVERFIVKPEISSESLSLLGSVVDKIRSRKEIGSAHAMILVENKLLSLYSSKNADDISESDILIINLLAKAHSMKNSSYQQLSDNQILNQDKENTKEANLSNLFEYTVLLKTKYSDSSPHIVYIDAFGKDLFLVAVVEVKRSQVSGQILDVLSYVEELRNGSSQAKDAQSVEFIDTSLKNTDNLIDTLPEDSSSQVKRLFSQVCTQWENLKTKGMREWVLSPSDTELPSALEAGSSLFMDSLKILWNSSCLDVAMSKLFQDQLLTVFESSKQKMQTYIPFLTASSTETSVDSESGLSIAKYIEEFPGMVHFIYVDRTTHQMTSPKLYSDKTENLYGSSNAINRINQLTTSKVWSMFNFARNHLSKGHNSVIWKDKTFSYSYFLWFEDQSANPLKPIQANSDGLKKLPIPGVLCGDFYKAFAEISLPTIPAKSYRAFELFCVHLGMVTSPCILEQTRRLAATVWEVAGPLSANPLDIL